MSCSECLCDTCFKYGIELFTSYRISENVFTTKEETHGFQDAKKQAIEEYKFKTKILCNMNTAPKFELGANPKC